MSDPRKIELQVTATGGEQAAGELRKVEVAADSLAGSAGSAKGLKAVQEEATKVTASNVRMGTGFQNVGYQVQDLAVQLDSGTSAFRALGQQLPQLLSGFGPLGITLGTVAAVALPLAGAMFNLGESTAEAGEKADEAEEKLKKLTDARTKEAIAKGAEANKAYLDSLDDEEAAITRVNDAIDRKLELMRAERRAQAEIQSAQAALDLAKIDADTNLTEPQKIKARAEVERDLERKKFEDRKFEANLRVTDATNKASEVTGQESRLGEDLATARRTLEEQEAERARLRGRVSASNQATAALPDLEKRLADLDNRINNAPGDDSISAERFDQLLRERGALKQDVESTQKARDGASGADRERLAVLGGLDGKSGDIGDTKKKIEELTEAARKLSEAAVKARADAAAITERETTNVAGDQRATALKLEASRIKSESGAARLEKTESDKADGLRTRDAERDSKDLDRGIAKSGRDAVALLPEGVKKEFSDAVKSVSRRLQDGDQGGELSELIGLMRELAESSVAKDSRVQSEISDLRTTIGILQKQIRNR